MRYRVVTFGCQQNEADSERIRFMLSEAGFLPSEREGDEDVVIVNTCAIRAHAEAKALSMLGAYKRYKRLKPHFTLGLVGCMGAKPDTVDRVKKDFHYVSFTSPPSTLYRIPEYVYNSISGKGRIFDPDRDITDIVEGIGAKRTHAHKAWVSVMYGCNNFCSYCIVPYVRGRERSRRSSDVISECRELVAKGTREITLLGQNVNSYSADMSFPQLLAAIAEIDGDFIIRFMTSHPKDTSDELISVMKKYCGKIAPYFHLPLQSGSDRILKAMNRTYSAAKYLEIAEKLRSEIPGIAISTDIIIGFPGEEDEDFEATLDILRKVRYDLVYAFLYSPREGTRAATMEPKVARDVQNARMARLIPLAEEISYTSNLPYVGRVERVLVDSVTDEDRTPRLSGRTGSNKLVYFTSEGSVQVGDFVNVRIDEARAYDLIGTAL